MTPEYPGARRQTLKKTLGFGVLPIDNQIFPPCKVDITLEDKQHLSFGGVNFDIIHVPGHTLGCVIYSMRMHQKEIWFTGDFIMTESLPAGVLSNPIRASWTGDIRYNAKDYLSSLKKVWKRKPDAILGGHGCFLLDNAQNTPKIAYQIALQTIQTR